MVNRLLAKLLLRELKGNWFQYLSMLVITFLAVTLFTGFVSNTITLRTRTDLYMEQSNVASLILQATVFEDSDVSFLQDGGGIDELEFRTYADGAYSVSGSAEGAIESTLSAKFYITDGNEKINRPYIVEGEAGFMIDKSVAGLYGCRVGDKVTVDMSARASAIELPGIPSSVAASVLGRLEFTVTGLMYSIEGVNIYDTSPAFITYGAFWQSLTDNPLVKAALSAAGIDMEDVIELTRNQALIRCADGEAVRGDVNAYFNAKAQNNLVFIYDRESMESVVVLDNEASQSLNMLYVFPVLFFLVAVLVIMTTIGRLILRERTNVGTMKALGISNAKIVLLYASLGGAVTFIGSCLGAAVGPLIIPSVMNIKYGLIYSMPMLCGILYSPLWTTLTIAVVTAAALLIGVGCSRSIIREKPAECMRPKQTAYAPKRTIDTGGTNQAALTCRMGLRNIAINKRRALMTVIGITGCTALLLTSFGIGDTIDASVYNDFGGMFRYDVLASCNASAQSGVEEELSALKDAGEIQNWEFNRIYAATAAAEGVTKTVAVYVIPDDSTMTDVLEGGGVALSASTAEDLGAEAGDSITFTVGSCSVKYTVGRIVTTTTRNGLYITQSDNSFTEDCYYTANVWIQTSSPEAVRDKLMNTDDVLAASTMGEQLEEIRSLASTVNTMKYTVMVFAIALSVVVLYNLSLLNVKERTRDMATLKVLGFTNGKIAATLFVESFTLTFAGTAVGMLLGFPLLYLVMKLNELATIAFIYYLAPLSYFLSALISLGTGAVINVLFGAVISKIDMTASLKSVE